MHYVYYNTNWFNVHPHHMCESKDPNINPSHNTNKQNYTLYCTPHVAWRHILAVRQCIKVLGQKSDSFTCNSPKNHHNSPSHPIEWKPHEFNNHTHPITHIIATLQELNPEYEISNPSSNPNMNPHFCSCNNSPIISIHSTKNPKYHMKVFVHSHLVIATPLYL